MNLNFYFDIRILLNTVYVHHKPNIFFTLVFTICCSTRYSFLVFTSNFFSITQLKQQN